MADTTPLQSLAQPQRTSGTRALIASTSIKTQLGPLLGFLGLFATGIYAAARLEGRIDAIQANRELESRALSGLTAEVRSLHDALIYLHAITPGGALPPTAGNGRTLPSQVAP